MEDQWPIRSCYSTIQGVKKLPQECFEAEAWAWPAGPSFAWSSPPARPCRSPSGCARRPAAAVAAFRTRDEPDVEGEGPIESHPEKQHEAIFVVGQSTLLCEPSKSQCLKAAANILTTWSYTSFTEIHFHQKSISFSSNAWGANSQNSCSPPDSKKARRPIQAHLLIVKRFAGQYWGMCSWTIFGESEF